MSAPISSNSVRPARRRRRPRRRAPYLGHYVGGHGIKSIGHTAAWPAAATTHHPRPPLRL
jgi:hypothetical protein